MEFARWDIVAVDYPFVEGTGAKRRPALVVSTTRLAERHGVLWAAMITTAKAGIRDDDIPISNPAAAGLPEECVIRLTRLASIPLTQISRRLGSLAAKERNAVIALFKRFCP